MKKSICSWALLMVLVCCKKKTELDFRGNTMNLTYSIESGCDTTHIDSLRYLDEDLNWKSVYQPSLPWSSSHYYTDVDSTALEVFGVAGNQSAFPPVGVVEIKIKGSFSERYRGSVRSELIHQREDINPWGNTLRFSAHLAVKK